MAHTDDLHERYNRTRNKIAMLNRLRARVDEGAREEIDTEIDRLGAHLARISSEMFPFHIGHEE